VFYGCSSFTSITIPAGVTTIEYNAFGSCTSLTSVTFQRNDTTTIGNSFPGDLVTKSGGGGAVNRYGTWTVTSGTGNDKVWTKV